MKELSFDEMEVLEGGWSWAGCATTMFLATTTGVVAYAGLATGGGGAVVVMVGACLAGGIAGGSSSQPNTPHRSF